MTGPPYGAYDPERARAAVGRIARHTPTLLSHDLSDRSGTSVLLKLETLQITGSFKIRGAASKIFQLPSDPAPRVVACSSGNHGRAVAFVAEHAGIQATICVPDWVDPVKRRAMEQHGAHVILSGGTYNDAEAEADRLARRDGLTPVHPFDDADVIAGQGTIGLELIEDIPDLEDVLVPLSGGGLIAGIAVAFRLHRPGVRIIGVSAQNAGVMVESLAAGHPIDRPELPTIANALSGGIGIGNAHTFALVRDLVDTHITVTEHEIEAAMAFSAARHRIVTEGGGAVAVAALLANKVDPRGPCAVVVSGGNIAPQAFADAITRGGVTSGV